MHNISMFIRFIFSRILFIFFVAVSTVAHASWRNYMPVALGGNAVPVVNAEAGLEPLKNAVLAQPNAVAPRLALANAYVQRGILRKAIKELQKAQKNGGDVTYRLVALLLQTQQPDEAQTALSAIQPVPPAMQATHYMWQARINEALLRLPQAAATWQQLRTQFAAMPDGYLGQANIALWQNDTAAAEAAVNAIPPNSVAPSAWYLSIRGRLALAQRNWPYAQSFLEQAIAADAEQLDAYVPLLQALLQQSKFLEAQQFAAATIKKMPEVYVGYVMMGITTAATQFYPEADKYFNSITNKNILPYAEGLLYHAIAKIQLGNQDAQAEMLLQQFLEQRPNNALAKQFLGNVLMSGGRYSSAESFYSAALKQQPNNYHMMEALIYLALKQNNRPHALDLLRTFNANPATAPYLKNISALLCVTACSIDPNRGALLAILRYNIVYDSALQAKQQLPSLLQASPNDAALQALNALWLARQNQSAPANAIIKKLNSNPTQNAMALELLNDLSVTIDE